MYLYEWYEDWKIEQEYQKREQERRMSIEECMPKIKYDPERLWGIKDCAICLIAFNEEDEVTPLLCDIRHTFHYECITTWFKSQIFQNCPTCRGKVTKSEMKHHKEQINYILDERTREMV